jgi:hypothetical protein
VPAHPQPGHQVAGDPARAVHPGHANDPGRHGLEGRLGGERGGGDGGGRGDRIAVGRRVAPVAVGERARQHHHRPAARHIGQRGGRVGGRPGAAARGGAAQRRVEARQAQVEDGFDVLRLPPPLPQVRGVGVQGLRARVAHLARRGLGAGRGEHPHAVARQAGDERPPHQPGRARDERDAGQGCVSPRRRRGGS